ncbi:hypothetical protein Celal_3412 [Cellulophaga algicola DSM 14237]|uniref:Uncharacterized protein n=1 Tax=Cellulophaga algicola (strain DSM 14237 / IC166 / ACAM 630) TaxID=688270 RepID=E6X6W4_CELAD|nr:zinc-ribbon domain-containing protein [Cellulophaga algicola]ADV50677.1 hypothetical protein Celal_3412 [Cellulophaga algicola DSM 14237]
MIFYGTKGTHLHSERKSGIKCDNCNENTVHNLSVYGKYAYLYWIPVFPMGRKSFSECTNCKVTLEQNGMNEKLKNASKEVSKNTKTPIWYWSGLGIILAIIGVIIFTNLKHSGDLQDYINEPAVGDVIKYKNSESGYFTTLKITSITADSVFVIQNDYETNKKSDVNEIDKLANYTEPSYFMGKDEIRNLFDEKVFYDIKR